MSVQQGIFSAKLCEMEKQYEKFQAHLVTCQQMEHEAEKSAAVWIRSVWKMSTS